MNIKKVLLDTDIGPDCDDVAALAMLNLYADDGLCEILGIGHCTSNPFGAGCIDAVCRYYGRADIPIGTFGGKGFLDDEKCMKYNADLCRTLPNRYQSDKPGEVVELYRKILAAQDDLSVDFVAIGPLNNLSDLLNSKADHISELDGKSLVAQKVRRLVSMAGVFPADNPQLIKRAEEITGVKLDQLKEFNVVCDIPAAQNVVQNWPTPIVLLGFEAGLAETGAVLQQKKNDSHPIKMAYKLYTENGDRFSWDLFTVEYAINPECGHYKLSECGTVSFDDQGRTKWQPEPQGRMRFVEWAVDEERLIKDINNLLLRKPAGHR